LPVPSLIKVLFLVFGRLSDFFSFEFSCRRSHLFKSCLLLLSLSKILWNVYTIQKFIFKVIIANLTSKHTTISIISSIWILISLQVIQGHLFFWSFFFSSEFLLINLVLFGSKNVFHFEKLILCAWIMFSVEITLSRYWSFILRSSSISRSLCSVLERVSSAKLLPSFLWALSSISSFHSFW